MYTVERIATFCVCVCVFLARFGRSVALLCGKVRRMTRTFTERGGGEDACARRTHGSSLVFGFPADAAQFLRALFFFSRFLGDHDVSSKRSLKQWAVLCSLLLLFRISADARCLGMRKFFAKIALKQFQATYTQLACGSACVAVCQGCSLVLLGFCV